MRILLLTAETTRRLRPRWGGELIVAGPVVPNRMVEDRVISLATPPQGVDVAQLIAGLPSEQRPDVVICQPAQAFFPTNFSSLGVPTALVVEDFPETATGGAVLVKYAVAEAFTRVILASDWRAAGCFRRAGCTSVFWHPGLLFPHSDRQIEMAMQTDRAREIAISMRLEAMAPAEIALLSGVLKRGLPVDFRDPLLAEPLMHGGSSLAGLAPGGSFGEAQLRFLATGTLLFTDSGYPENAAGDWKAGRDYIAYRSIEQLCERVTEEFRNVDRALAVAQSGRRWFLTHCADEPRRRMLQQIIFDGREDSAFELPLTSPAIVTRGAGSGEVEGAEIGRIRVALRRGELGAALNLAQRLPETRAQRHLLMGEVALEAGNPALFSKALDQARALAPTEPRAQLMQLLHALRAIHPVAHTRVVEEGWLAYGRGECHPAHFLAGRALQMRPKDPAASHLKGMALLQIAELAKDVEASYHLGQALKFLNEAVAQAPGNATFREDLGYAARQAGLLPEAIEAYQHAIDLGNDGDLVAFGLGEAWLADNQPERAGAALRAGLKRSPEHNLLRLWLGHCEKQCGRLREALDLHRTALGAVSAQVTSRARRRVVFLAQHPPMWTNSASVYAAFAADPTWEVAIVALPYLIPTFQGQYDESNAVFDFLTRKGLPFVRGDEFDLRPGFADVLFVENPYDYTRPKGWKIPDLIDLVPRLAYIPYGIEIGAGRQNNLMVMSLTLQQVAWRVFARSERQRQAYGRHCVSGNAHVVVTGHPRMDVLLDLPLEHDVELERQIGDRKAVLWNPHLDARLNGTRFGRGFSTFLGWRFFMLEEFARRPDMFLVIRPHPQLFSMLHAHGVQTQAQIDAYFARCAALPNVVIDRRPSYLAAFAATQAIMSDASSFVLEYAVTGHPVLYLRNPGSPGLDPDGEFVTKYCHTADTEAEIRRFLDRVAAGQDPEGDLRRAAIREFMFRPQGGVGAAIKRTVDEALTNESPAPAARAVAGRELLTC